MAQKAFNVRIELGIQAVTCPGVWLCPKGKVSLRFRMFGVSGQTKELPPVFPLLFHESFSFRKTFSRVRYLTDLQLLFRNHFLCVELFQWPEQGNVGNILASFETSLEELLYPSPCGRGLIAGVDVDLLMEPTCCFPGILAPKIEVNTKTTIEEVYNSNICPIDDAFVINHKMISSKTAVCAGKKRRQRRVCHTNKRKLADKDRSRPTRRIPPNERHERGCASGNCVCVGRAVRSHNDRPETKLRCGRPRCSSPCCPTLTRNAHSTSPTRRTILRADTDCRATIDLAPGKRCGCPLERNQGTCPVCDKYERAFETCNVCRNPTGRAAAFPNGCLCDQAGSSRPNQVHDRFTSGQPTSSAYQPSVQPSFRPIFQPCAGQPSVQSSNVRPSLQSSGLRPGKQTSTFRDPNVTCHCELTVRQGKSGKSKVNNLGQGRLGGAEKGAACKGTAAAPIRGDRGGAACGAGTCPAGGGGVESAGGRAGGSPTREERSLMSKQLQETFKPSQTTDVYSFLGGQLKRDPYQPPLGMTSKPSYRDVFYQNLEKFYKKLYDKAKCNCKPVAHQ